jgi:hypothetical protein
VGVKNVKRQAFFVYTGREFRRGNTPAQSAASRKKHTKKSEKINQKGGAAWHEKRTSR